MSAAGALAALFDDAARPAPDAAELAFYAARLPRAAGTILDAACGAGRLLVPLLERGLALHGVDATAARLDACRARLAAANRETTLVRQSLEDLNLPFRYAGAYVAGPAFQQLADPVAARAALGRLRAHLVPPGVLVLDLFVPPEGTQRLGAALVEVRTAHLPDGSHIALRSETTMYAEERIARTHNRYVHRQGTRRLREETGTRALTWYPREAIVALVAEAGFVDVVAGPPASSGAEGDAYCVVARL